MSQLICNLKITSGNIVKNMECLRNSEEFYNPNLADDILNATRPLLKRMGKSEKGN